MTEPNSSFIFLIAMLRVVPVSESTIGCFGYGLHSSLRPSRAADNLLAVSMLGKHHLVGKKATLMFSWVPLVLVT